MKIVFRTDSSLQMGSGHVMRCLTLADELRQRGAEVLFICRELPGNLISLIEGKGYQVVHLHQPEVDYCAPPDDVAHAAWLGVSWEHDAVETINALPDEMSQWLIIDHYAMDRRWEEMLRSHVCKIMVIDDLADRPHDCDLLLDQNLYQGMEVRYDGLVPQDCRLLLGPRYALLRPEFAEERRSLRNRDGQVQRILVFLGGCDASNESEKALTAIQLASLNCASVDVVVGSGNPHRNRIEKICSDLPWANFYCQVENMAELMSAADLAIGAGGSSTWERCSLALPSIVIAVAHNQEAIANAAGEAGVIYYLGTAPQVSAVMLQQAITQFSNSNDLMFDMSEKAKLLVDGYGTQYTVMSMDIK